MNRLYRERKKSVDGRLPKINASSSSSNILVQRRPSFKKEMKQTRRRRLPSVEDATPLPPPTPSSGLGLGVSLWLNRFVHKARKGSPGGYSKNGSEAELVTNAKMSILNGGERRTSWGDLRRSIVQSKISDALSHLKFKVNGKTYAAIKVIGEGGFSKVYEVFNRDKELFALKVVNFVGVTDFLKADLLREITFLKRFQGCPNVIEMIDFEHYQEEDGDVNCLHILMERGECALSTILRSLTNNSRLTPAKLRFYWEQMLEAIQTVHAERIVHADVKPANFLMVQGQLKLIDFGFAGQAKPGEDFVTRNFVGGTKDYMSPESLSHYVIEEGSIDLTAMRQNNCPIRVGFKSDIWALGVILYQLVYDGIAPFSSVPGGRAGKINALISPDYAVEFDGAVDDPHLLDTMKMCLEKNPAKRADLQTLLKHPFLRPDICTGLLLKGDASKDREDEEAALLLKKLELKDSS